MKTIIVNKQQHYFRKFKQGDEKGLEFFYKRFFPRLYYRGKKYIKDEVNACAIVHDAFMMLWLIRNTIKEVENIEHFLKKRTFQGFKEYYMAYSTRFQHAIVELDAIENYQQFIGGYDPWIDDDTDVVDQHELDETMRLQMKEVEAVLPFLHENQQLFIRLCLQHSFNYERIAWHIGGISDYQVAKQVEKTLERIKQILGGTSKLDAIGKPGKFTFEGNICKEHSSILRMRYELKYSFEEISAALNLDQKIVQSAFATAYARIKKVKI